MFSSLSHFSFDKTHTTTHRFGKWRRMRKKSKACRMMAEENLRFFDIALSRQDIINETSVYYSRITLLLSPMTFHYVIKSTRIIEATILHRIETWRHLHSLDMMHSPHIFWFCCLEDVSCHFTHTPQDTASKIALLFAALHIRCIPPIKYVKKIILLPNITLFLRLSSPPR